MWEKFLSNNFFCNRCISDWHKLLLTVKVYISLVNYLINYEQVEVAASTALLLHAIWNEY